MINHITNSIKAYQWLPSITAAYVKSVVPQIGATGADPDLVQAVIGDGSNPILTSQVSLQVDDAVVAAQVIKTGAETTVTYTPSRLLAPASRHTATLLFQDGANPVSRAWQFTVGAYTQDKVRSYVGTLQGNATYTADAGGHSGKPSDYAIDFGRVGGGSVYIKRAGQFLNVASTHL